MSELNFKYSIQDILEADNVAELVEAEDLRLIGMDVCDRYDADKDSRTEWEGRIKDSLDLALQVVEHKSTPWEGAANVKYPLLSTAALQFSARAYPALVPGFNVVKGRVLGYDLDGMKTAKSLRISKHMSYQLLEEMADWEEEMDKLTMVLPILGTVFKKTYYDSLNQRNRSELVLPSDLVVDYWAKNLEDARSKTHVITMSKNDIHERVVSKIFLDVDLSEPAQPEEQDGQDRAGLTPSTNVGPHVVLEQHTYLDLDGDGYEEPYCITVHEDSGDVLRIVKRFDSASIKWMGEKIIIKITPIEYFTKFGFIPSPDGSFYDIGFGTLLGPINDTINTTLNQLLDAGTLSTMQAGFISNGLRIAGGATGFKPGEFKKVQSIGTSIKDSVMLLPLAAPSSVLFNLLSTMITAGEKLSSVTDMMTGEIPGQNTKATVAVTAIEQGMKVFNAIYKRIHRSLKSEFRKVYDLNARYLPPIGYFNMLGVNAAAPIGRGDYQVGDIDVIPYSDPNIATEAQKVSKLEMVSSLFALGTIDPMEYTMRFLEATEQPNIEKLLAKPQGPNPEQQATQAELELKKFKEQSLHEREILKIQVADKLANAKVSQSEIDSVVALLGVAIDKQIAEKDVKESKMEASKTEK